MNTKRRVLAQLLVCDGCCCNHPERGHDAVPVEWLRAQWKARKLTSRVDLTTPYCLGPCDAANVLCVLTPAGSRWFGGLKTAHYPLVLDWAARVSEAGTVVPLPAALDELEFERWSCGAVKDENQHED